MIEKFTEETSAPGHCKNDNHGNIPCDYWHILQGKWIKILVHYFGRNQ
jgi:hypothetical protein